MMSERKAAALRAMAPSPAPSALSGLRDGAVKSEHQRERDLEERDHPGRARAS